MYMVVRCEGVVVKNILQVFCLQLKSKNFVALCCFSVDMK